MVIHNVGPYPRRYYAAIADNTATANIGEEVTVTVTVRQSARPNEVVR